MPEHDRDAVTVGRRRRRRQRGGRGGGRGAGDGLHRADQAVRLAYAATYLMSSPGTQQLLLWGGHQARELLGHTVGLVTDHQRLTSAAAAWHAASGDLHRAAGELTGHLSGLAGWESDSAGSYRAGYLARVGRLTGMAETYRDVGDTLARAADQLGRLYGALLACTHAAGESVRLLADGMNPDGAARAVVDAWASGGRALLDAWAAHADHTAATLTAAHADHPAAIHSAANGGTLPPTAGRRS